MEKVVYKADTRGSADHGWLKTNFTFSFAGYYNPERVHFGTLRVFNDDVVAAGEGFGMHPHDNMEIVTIPLSGSLEHRDSEGNRFVVKHGDVQHMSAGKGMMHSEYNPSDSEDVSLLQIWVFPKVKNIDPVYSQKTFDTEEWKDTLVTVVSPEESDNSLKINQDAYFSLGDLSKGKKIDYNVKIKGNGAFIFIIEGDVKVNGELYNKRDSIGIRDTDKVELEAVSNSKVLVIDLPMRMN